MNSRTNNIVSSDSVSPSIEGGKGWVSILKILIAVLTALAGALGVASCTKEKAPSTPPEGEPTNIAEIIMPRHYEHTPISRDV